MPAMPGGYDPNEPEPEPDRWRLLAAHRAATDFYRGYLLDEPRATAYLDSRGIAPAVAVAPPWTVGYAPRGWTVLRDHLRGVGFTDAELLAAGLITTGPRHGPVDAFRDRVVFPIRDSDGYVVAFIGRDLSGRPGTPKYRNTATTPIYRKSELLYGLAEQFGGGRRPDAVLIAEGPADVVAVAGLSPPGPPSGLWPSPPGLPPPGLPPSGPSPSGLSPGLPPSGPPAAGSVDAHRYSPGGYPADRYPADRYGAVAPCGTALTAAQVVLLASAVEPGTPVVCAFDADVAGAAATEQAYRLLRGWPGPVEAVVLPDGEDPASLVAGGPAGALATLRGSRVPLADLILDRRLAPHLARRRARLTELARLGRDPSSESRQMGVDAVHALAGLLAEVADAEPLHAAQLLARMSVRLDLNPLTVFEAVYPPPPTPPSFTPPPPFEPSPFEPSPFEPPSFTPPPFQPPP